MTLFERTSEEGSFDCVRTLSENDVERILLDSDRITDKV